MITFKPISNRMRRLARDAMKSQGLLNIDPHAKDFDGLAFEENLTKIVVPFVQSWDFKCVENGEPIPLDAENIYELMAPEQTEELLASFKAKTSGKTTVPPKKGGR